MPRLQFEDHSLLPVDFRQAGREEKARRCSNDSGVVEETIRGLLDFIENHKAMTWHAIRLRQTNFNIRIFKRIFIYIYIIYN